MTEREIEVYIRKGAHDQERIFSFRQPDEIDSAKVLAADMAMDGDSIIFAVSGRYDEEERDWIYSSPHFGREDIPKEAQHTLAGELALAEKGLARLLGDYGYEVEFK